MKKAKFSDLSNKIVRPGIENKLVPLLLYRGSQGMARMHRLWNFALTCMDSEVGSFTEATRLARSPDYSHLCGPNRPVEMMTLRGLFCRLDQNPLVTDNIPGFTNYVRTVEGRRLGLVPIHIYTNDPYHPDRAAPWRIPDYSPERKAEIDAMRLSKQLRKKLTKALYPLLAVDKGVALTTAVKIQESIPDFFPTHIKIDLCQDLMTDVLEGRINANELEERDSILRAMLIRPFKYEPGLARLCREQII